MEGAFCSLDPTLGYAFLEQQNGFPDVQWVKNLPAMQGTQETWVRSLGWEEFLSPGIGNGNPLQYSCLENSVDNPEIPAFPGEEN